MPPGSEDPRGDSRSRCRPGGSGPIPSSAGRRGAGSCSGRGIRHGRRDREPKARPRRGTAARTGASDRPEPWPPPRFAASQSPDRLVRACAQCTTACAITQVACGRLARAERAIGRRRRFQFGRPRAPLVATMAAWTTGVVSAASSGTVPEVRAWGWAAWDPGSSRGWPAHWVWARGKAATPAIRAGHESTAATLGTFGRKAAGTPPATAEARRAKRSRSTAKAGSRVRTRRSEPATVSLDSTGLTLEVGTGRPIRAGYRDLSLIAIQQSTVLLVLGDGPDAMRWILEKFGDRLGPLVRTLRELRLKQRLSDGLVKVPDGPAELVEFAWTPTASPLGPGPDGPATATTGVGQLVVHAMGLRRLPDRRASQLDPLPARVHRDRQDARSRRRGHRRRARHAHLARPRPGSHPAPRHAAEASRRRLRRRRRLRGAASAGRPVRREAEGVGHAGGRTADKARSIRRLRLAHRRDGRAGRARIRRQLPVAVPDGRDGRASVGRHVAGGSGRHGPEDLVPHRHAGEPGRPGAGHGRRPRDLLLPSHAPGAVQGRAAGEARHRRPRRRSGISAKRSSTAASCASRWRCPPISCGCRST